MVTRIAALVGPTASGKTALAVRLADRGLPVEVVCCDALQVVRGLDAATAKPSAAERASVRHHLLDLVGVDERMTAGRWAAHATAAIADITERGRWPLVVGGTGLYLRALVEGLVAIPPVPSDLRRALNEEWSERGAAAMHAELSRVDARYAARTPATNRQRVVRALEVWRATGRSFSDWHDSAPAAVPCFDLAVAVLEPERVALHGAIERRAAAMVAPLVAEVRQLLTAGVSAQAPGMQAIGYRDAVEVVLGTADEANLAGLVAAAHRRYAKRQITWFRRLTPRWRLDAHDPAAAALLAEGLQGHFGAKFESTDGCGR